MDKEKKVRSKEEILLKSFPHLGTRFDTIDDVIAELGEFGYGCVLAAMEEYASQLTPSSREEEQWISVEDRLPEDMQEVLFCNNDVKDWNGNPVKTPSHSGYFANRNFYSWLDSHDRFMPTHWMPMPSPPPKKLTPK